MHGDGPAFAEADALRGLIEAVPAATFIDPVDGDHLEFISPQIEAMLGFPPDAWLQGPEFWASRIHPDDAVYVRRAYYRSRRTGLPYTAEYRMFAADGHAVWVHVQAKPIRNPDGSARALAGVILDVTERRRADDGMRDSEARYRALVEASPDAIVVTDLEGRVVMANDSAAHLAGLEHGSLLVGKSALETVVDDDRHRVGDALGRAVLGEPVRGLGFWLQVGARTIPVEANGEVIMGEHGPDAVVAVIRDVSDRLDAAEARRESEAKSRFLATMSHELRTPLNSILGFAQLLASQDFGPLTDRQERYVEHIEASGRQLLDLVNEVLDLARLNSGQLDLALENERLGDVVQDALTRLRPVAIVKGVELKLDLEPGVKVLADRRRLVQVTWNLLSNAIKFTPAGGSVTLRAFHEQGDCVIEVIDTGIGIPEDARSRIFDEFFQVEQGRNRNGEGSGVGLALARRLVELMGGSIGVESEVGAGSTFTVRLPAGAYHEPVDGPAVFRGTPAAAAGFRPDLRPAG